MTHGSLFSGIGGFDLAAEWMGWDNVFHCEWNEFGARVLHHYWPEAISYHDITTTDFTIHRGTIDILTGGFPCQPYSAAGKRKGKDDARHLWPHMLRAIREIRPRYVVGENVGGLLTWNAGLVFDEVQSELESEGYEVIAFVLPACAVGAPHKRDRVWIVAHADRERCTEEWGSNAEPEQWIEQLREIRFTTNPQSVGPGRIRDESTEKGTQGGDELLGECLRVSFDGKRDAEHPLRQRLQGIQVDRGAGGVGQEKDQHATRPLRPTWQDFPTQPPICGRDDGLPRELDGVTFPKWRNQSVMAYGNAIVPQVAYQIFQAIAGSIE